VRIALTGGIATGKSVVGRGLRARGFAMIDADQAAREAVVPGSAALTRIVERFGQRVLQPDGALDRPTLGRLVFADPAARADLERIVHPLVRDRIDRFFAALAPAAIGIAEIPLAYETGWAERVELVVVVACRAETQRQRLAARDGLDADAVEQRLAAQWPIEDKVRLADAVVMTEGDLTKTEDETAALAAWLRSRPSPSSPGRSALR
jgi:dephospho-CoA kinase